MINPNSNSLPDLYCNGDKITGSISRAILTSISEWESKTNQSLILWEEGACFNTSKQKKRWFIKTLAEEARLWSDKNSQFEALIRECKNLEKVSITLPQRTLSALSKANTNYHIRYTTIYPLILKETGRFKTMSPNQIISSFRGEDRFINLCKKRWIESNLKGIEEDEKSAIDLIYSLESQRINPTSKNGQLNTKDQERFDNFLESTKHDLFKPNGSYFTRIVRSIREMEKKGAEREMAVARKLANWFNKRENIQLAEIKCACSGDQEDMLKGIDIKIIYQEGSSASNCTPKTMTIQVKPTKAKSIKELLLSKDSPLNEKNLVITPAVGKVKKYLYNEISHLAFIFNSYGQEFIFIVKNKKIELSRDKENYLIPLENFNKTQQAIILRNNHSGIRAD